MRYLTEKGQGFYWEAEGNSENAMTIFKNQGGGLSVAVSEEYAMDSYNSTFECSAFLSEAEAIKLRDYLNEEFPRQS